MRKLFRKLKNITLLDCLLIILTIFLLSYLISSEFRCFLDKQGYEVGLFSGLIAALALIFALKQSISDKKFAYNLATIGKIEDAAANVISLLLKLYNDAEVCKRTVGNIRKHMDTDQIFEDANNVLERLNDSSSYQGLMAAAYLNIYFPSQKKRWNKLLQLMGELGSISVTAYKNYKDNDNGKIPNVFLGKIDLHLERANELCKVIELESQALEQEIVKIVNEVKISTKNKIK